MTLFELVVSKNAYYLKILGILLLSKNDPIMADRKYGISIDTQPRQSIMPVVCIYHGTMNQELWFNNVGYVEENTVLTYDGPESVVELTIRVEDFDYRFRSGTVCTVRADNGQLMQKPKPCWILIPEQRGKTPLRTIDYISFTDRNNAPIDATKAIKQLLVVGRSIDKLREQMK